MYHANTNQKKAGVFLFFLKISDKLNFRIKSITRTKTDISLTIKQLIQHEDVTILNVLAPNNKASI